MIQLIHEKYYSLSKSSPVCIGDNSAITPKYTYTYFEGDRILFISLNRKVIYINAMNRAKFKAICKVCKRRWLSDSNSQFYQRLLTFMMIQELYKYRLECPTQFVSHQGQAQSWRCKSAGIWHSVLATAASQPRRLSNTTERTWSTETSFSQPTDNVCQLPTSICN